MKNEKKNNNIINFPNSLTNGEREVEAILFAASEPLEIERVILKNPSISQCSVLVRDDQIVAFFVGSKSDDEIKKYCRKYLPDYMVPNIAIPILKIPLNQNSKTDRKALYEIFENFNSKKLKCCKMLVQSTGTQ